MKKKNCNFGLLYPCLISSVYCTEHLLAHLFVVYCVNVYQNNVDFAIVIAVSMTTIKNVIVVLKLIQELF